MTRIMKLVALTAVLSLVLAGVALAAFTKVTGGTTTLTASDAAAKVLSDNHITRDADLTGHGVGDDVHVPDHWRAAQRQDPARRDP